MKECTYCGQALVAGLADCGSCGQTLPVPSAVTAAPVVTEPVTTADDDASEFTKYFYAATPRVWATYTLLALNALIFLLMGWQAGNLVHPNLAVLLDWGANWGPLTATGGGWWRLLTAAFLHFTIFHLLCNLFALWQAGLLAERLFGNWFFLALYFSTAVLSSLASLHRHPTIISAGASGAVFGVYGALLGYLVRQRGALPRHIWASLGKTILIFVALNLFYGLTQLQVDNAAHVGGLFSGLVLGWLAARPLQPSHRRALLRPAIIYLAVGVVVLLVPLVAFAPRSSPRYGRLLNDMGVNLARGVSLPKNPVAAVWWYQKAAQLGSAEAEYNLGRRYFNTNSDVAFNPAEGIKWFRTAAEHGSTNAEISLGIIYYNGDGIPADHAEARQWIERSAAHGQAGEQLLLGQMYHQGDGTARDLGAAFKWMQLAAAQGLPEAQAHLAGFYLRGEGTATNVVAAAQWAGEAANHGQPNAQYLLATLYATGEGVPQNAAEAYAWFKLAARSEAPVALAASNILSQLAPHLTPFQLASAGQRVSELTQKIAEYNRLPPVTH